MRKKMTRRDSGEAILSRVRKALAGPRVANSARKGTAKRRGWPDLAGVVSV